MSDARKLNVTRRGVVTLPKDLRDKYDIDEGDVMTLIDLDGTFVVRPGTLEVDRLADRIRSKIEDEGESLESLLKELQDRREETTS